MILKKFFTNSVAGLKRSDFLIIIVFGALLAFLTFYTMFKFDTYHLEQADSFVRVVSAILKFPAIITIYSLFLVFGRVDTTGFGSAILGSFLSPLFGFFIYYFIFLIISILSSKIFRSTRFLAKHGLSVCIVVLMFSPFIYYSWGSTEMNACLSGKLNYTYHATLGDLPIGPQECFEHIIRKDLSKSSSSIEYCENLSDTLQVAEPNPFNKDLPSLSYQEYCSYKLNIYPPEILCEKISDGNLSQEKICTGQFTWKNRPVAMDGVITSPIEYKPIETSGRANYEGETGVTLKRSIDEKESTWISGEILVSEGLNVIEFDISLLNNIPSQSLLTIYIDQDKIYTLDGRVFGEGEHHFKFDFPAYRPGTHILSFRLDTFAPGETQTSVKNIQTAFKDYPGVFDVPHFSDTGY